MAWGKEQAKATLRAIIAQDPVIVIAGNVTVSAARSTLRRQDLPQWEGLIDEYRESITVVNSDWPSSVGNDATITVDGETRRILNTELDAPRVGLRLDLGEQYARQ